MWNEWTVALVDELLLGQLGRERCLTGGRHFCFSSAG
jgi:hypothetical protein